MGTPDESLPLGGLCSCPGRDEMDRLHLDRQGGRLEAWGSGPAAAGRPSAGRRRTAEDTVKEQSTKARTSCPGEQNGELGRWDRERSQARVRAAEPLAMGAATLTHRHLAGPSRDANLFGREICPRKSARDCFTPEAGL